VALVVRNIADSIDTRGSQPTPSLFAGGRVRLFADYRLPPAGWWLAGFAIVVPILIVLLLRHTTIGRRLRAVSDDPILARLAGVPATRTLACSYLVAGAVGGLAGALYSSYFGLVFVSLGWQSTLKGFVAAVLGGVGWVRGAVLGGLALGAFESLVSTYVSTTYKDVFTYLLLIAVLVAAPRGVVAGNRLRTV
jgi:branched-subunit amino acid ABC-type transport system permease component